MVLSVDSELAQPVAAKIAEAIAAESYALINL